MMSAGVARVLSFSIAGLAGELSVDVQRGGSMSPLCDCIRYDLEP